MFFSIIVDYRQQVTGATRVKLKA